MIKEPHDRKECLKSYERALETIKALKKREAELIAERDAARDTYNRLHNRVLGWWEDNTSEREKDGKKARFKKKPLFVHFAEEHPGGYRIEAQRILKEKA